MDIASIIDGILSFPLVLDIVLVLFLLISTSLGFAKGFWRGAWRTLFVVIMLIVSWFFIVGPVSNWIADDMFKTLKLSATVEGTTISSLREYIETACRVGVETGSLDAKYSSSVYVAGLTSALTKSLAWLVLVIVIQFVSWIISALFYVLLIRLIIPKRIRAKKLKLLGALMGLIQGVVVAFCMMSAFSSLSPAVAKIADSNPAASWINQYIISIFKGFNPENSKILGPQISLVEKTLTEKLIGFEYEGETVNGCDALEEFFDYSNTLDTPRTFDPSEPEGPSEPETPNPEDPAEPETPNPEESTEESTEESSEDPNQGETPVEGLAHLYFDFQPYFMAGN